MFFCELTVALATFAPYKSHETPARLVCGPDVLFLFAEATQFGKELEWVQKVFMSNAMITLGIISKSHIPAANSVIP